MNNKIIGIIMLVAVISVGGYFLFTRKSFQKQLGQPQITIRKEQIEETPQVKEEVKKYTISEVALHAVKSDCWLAIEGKVYDVSDFIASGKHPGKDAIIKGCGKDATDLFNTRPMGSNTPHSEKARSFLPNYYIGDLK